MRSLAVPRTFPIHDIAQRLGLRRYPVLITATGIEQ
ncbi:TPA: DUF2859 domain-containing protein [Enterobacter hormaechei subsp. steigerwaltii]|nr:DUF2859 domain-containing protein [Enterobacter hormaechei subsp. steigerwaltii]